MYGQYFEQLYRHIHDKMQPGLLKVYIYAGFRPAAECDPAANRYRTGTAPVRDAVHKRDLHHVLQLSALWL